MDTLNQNKAPVRVLHVVTNMSYGGLENLLMSYYRQIDRTKVQFDFLTHFADHQDFEEEISALGGKLYRLPRLNPVSRFYQQALDAFFSEHREYRIVHSHLDCMAAVPLMAAQRAGIPVRIAHSHTSNQRHNWKYPIKLFWRSRIPAYATELFACGKAAGDWMFQGRPYRMLHNAVCAEEFQYDPARAAAVRKELDVENRLVIGHVGQFRAEKNHVFLVRIFGALLKKCPDAVLLLVGKGSTMQEAKACAEDLGILDHIRFLGARADISSILQAVDVFVLPSLYEGIPVTVIEAQSAGIPCIVSDHVPMECAVTDLVCQQSLEDAPDVWADTILAKAKRGRVRTLPQIRASGFDIGSNALALQKFYMEADHSGDTHGIHTGL